MSSRVLVAYATKYGSTAGIAEKIGEVLNEAGLRADVRPAKEVKDLSPYRAVVLGSAVYMGRWRKDAVKFLEGHETLLAQKPVWFFSSGPVEPGDPVELLEGWRFPPLQQAIADRIKPRDTAVFHGAIEIEKLNLFYKWIMNNFKLSSGDYRDWGMIAAWAEGIAAALE